MKQMWSRESILYIFVTLTRQTITKTHGCVVTIIDQTQCCNSATGWKSDKRF